MRRDPFQAIADPTRRSILSLLAPQPMTPNAIAGHFDSSRQAISKHLQILVQCELLAATQEGREIYYGLNAGKMQEIDAWLQPFRAMWENRFQNLDTLLTNLHQPKTKTK